MGVRLCLRLEKAWLLCKAVAGGAFCLPVFRWLSPKFCYRQGGVDTGMVGYIIHTVFNRNTFDWKNAQHQTVPKAPEQQFLF